MSASGRADDAVGVLDRMTLILDAFDQDDQGATIAQLATRSALPKSTVSRLVAALVQEGYLERDGRTVHLGVRLFELGRLAGQPVELRRVALPVMTGLGEATSHAVQLAIRAGHEMVCVATVRPQAAEPVPIRTGMRLPLHATAVGLVTLAYAPASLIDAVLAQPLIAFTPRTMTDAAALRSRLAQIRRGAPACEYGEFAFDRASVALAFVADGGAAAAISVSGRIADFDPAQHLPLLRLAADQLAANRSRRAPRTDSL